MANAVSEVVRIEQDGGVTVIIIDNPPMNVSSMAVRSAVLQAVEWARGRDGVQALVLIGAGSTFVAGADLREFDQPLFEPQLPAVIAALEACEKPIVAALHGTALGGGLELALGCDGRVALENTQLGLPEVTLGVIPGAGGTQRLPRLVGLPRALAMICSGERVSAEEALRLGLVDRVVTTDLRSAAIAYARTLAGNKRRVRNLPVPAVDEALLTQTAAAALRAGKQRPAVRAAIELVRSSRTLPIDLALAQERAQFQTLRSSREAKALRYQFFAERQAGKYAGAKGVIARPLRCIAVIGAGSMGTGITIAALDAGFEVTVLERERAALDRGIDRIHTYYAGRSETGKLTRAEADARRGRLSPVLEWSAVAEADLIIEAVFEDLAVKQSVFHTLDKVARRGAILATNTSYLDIDAIAQVTSRPQDVVGLHFFSPAQVMRLLEIVKATATSTEVLVTALQFGKSLRKISVMAGNSFGFIGNRLYSAYRRQCEFLLEEGASPQQVDSALEAFGFAMGPFAVADLSGLDIAWRMRQATAATRDPAARYVRIADLLCEAGRLGRKSGRGYYLYEGGSRVPDSTVEQFIKQARSENGITARPLSDAEITQRAVMALVNEAALLMETDVAQRASDIDVVMVNGFGFPRWEGGPVFLARERGAEAIAIDLADLARSSGAGFVRGDVGFLLNDENAGLKT